jgi:hypothetical protein
MEFVLEESTLLRAFFLLLLKPIRFYFYKTEDWKDCIALLIKLLFEVYKPYRFC